MAAGTFFETALVIERRLGEPGGRELDLLIYRAAVEVVSFTADQAEMARRAWRRFGKGRHPAGLNLGDCFAYALSRTSGEPLLFKGSDFSQTDVLAVTL
jgi:ribonuclease VapC